MISESSVLSAQTHGDGDVSITYTVQMLRLQPFPQQVEAILGGIVVMARWLAAQTRGAMRINDLADALGMSVRALQRQLQQEGQPWTALVDAARKQALSELLQQGLSPDAAALRLGYHDASSLSRAAKRWFGKTAGQHRLDSR